MRNIAVVPILDNKVVQTTQYRSPRYIGEPSDIVKQLSDMKADEIFVIDVGYRIKGRNYRRHNIEELEKIANQAFCPIGYGGGLYLDEHVQLSIDIVKAGYEKIIAASAWWRNSSFYDKLCTKIGRQSVVKCLEVDFDDIDDYEWIQEVIDTKIDCGELLLVDTTRNGMLSGLNMDLCSIAQKSPIPTSICGGYDGKNYDCDTAASTYYMLYKNQVMLNYANNHNSTL